MSKWSKAIGDVCVAFWEGPGCNIASALLAFATCLAILAGMAEHHWAEMARAERDHMAARAAIAELSTSAAERVSEANRRLLTTIEACDNELAKVKAKEKRGKR